MQFHFSSFQSFWACYPNSSTKWRGVSTKIEMLITNLFIIAEEWFQLWKNGCNTVMNTSSKEKMHRNVCVGRQFLFHRNELYTFTTLSQLLQRIWDWLKDHYFTWLYIFSLIFYCPYLLAPLCNLKTKRYMFLMTAEVLTL